MNEEYSIIDIETDDLEYEIDVTIAGETIQTNCLISACVPELPEVSLYRYKSLYNFYKSIESEEEKKETELINMDANVACLLIFFIEYATKDKHPFKKQSDKIGLRKALSEHFVNNSLSEEYAHLIPYVNKIGLNRTVTKDTITKYFKKDSIFNLLERNKSKNNKNDYKIKNPDSYGKNLKLVKGFLSNEFPNLKATELVETALKEKVSFWHP